jgi:hypothetical protein
MRLNFTGKLVTTLLASTFILPLAGVISSASAQSRGNSATTTTRHSVGCPTVGGSWRYATVRGSNGVTVTPACSGGLMPRINTNANSVCKSSSIRVGNPMADYSNTTIDKNGNITRPSGKPFMHGNVVTVTCER